MQTTPGTIGHTSHISRNGVNAAGPAQVSPGDDRRDRREMAERIVQFADALAPEDRAVIEAVYERGMTIADCARVGGCNRRNLHRRMTRLLKRLRDPLFGFVYQQRENWPTTRRRIAEHVFLRGYSQRDTSRRTGQSLHRVRKEVDRIRGMYEAARDLAHMLTRR